LILDFPGFPPPGGDFSGYHLLSLPDFLKRIHLRAEPALVSGAVIFISNALCANPADVSGMTHGAIADAFYGAENLITLMTHGKVFRRVRIDLAASLTRFFENDFR
jgi:hypothetical protein